MLCGHGRVNSAADIEIGGQAHESGLECGDQIVENPVGEVFVKTALVAKAPEVDFP